MGFDRKTQMITAGCRPLQHPRLAARRRQTCRLRSRARRRDRPRSRGTARLVRSPRASCAGARPAGTTRHPILAGLNGGHGRPVCLANGRFDQFQMGLKRHAFWTLVVDRSTHAFRIMKGSYRTDAPERCRHLLHWHGDDYRSRRGHRLRRREAPFASFHPRMRHSNRAGTRLGSAPGRPGDGRRPLP